MTETGQRGAHWAVPGFTEERQLGAGASGRVVAAVHQANGTLVAIKYLSPRLFQDPGFLAGFRDEAQLMKSLSNPHVVRLFDYVEEPGKGAAIVMELVNGVTLREMITRQGPTGPESALLVLKGSLLGLAAAHAIGVVHRDYKPENVLVDAQGESKLTDFGIATRQGSDAPVAGTPRYMAPEQWHGGPAAPATDIYAATAVFFECLTGSTPFSGGPQRLAAQHATAAVPVELVDESLRALVARGMAKDPASRPANATAFITELEATATGAYGQDWESRGRARFAARAAALLLLLLDGLLPGSTTAAAGGGVSTVTTPLGMPPSTTPAASAAAAAPPANAAAAAPGSAAPAAPASPPSPPASVPSAPPSTSPSAPVPTANVPPAPPGGTAPAPPSAPVPPGGVPRGLPRTVARKFFHLSPGQWTAAVVTVVAVAGSATAGALLGAHQSNSGSVATAVSSSPGASGTASSSPGASGTATSAAAPTTAACGSSGMPPLAYATSASASASPVSIQVRCGTAAPHTVATVPPGASNLAWSADGTQLAWLDSGSASPGFAVTAYVAQVNAGTWTTRHWACQCVGMAFLGKRAVTVNSKTAGGPQQFVTAQPQLTVFPATGTGQPATLTVTGITGNTRGTEFRLLGNVSPTQVVVSYGDAGGSNLGGAQTLYHVNAAGQATTYGHFTTSGTGQDPIFGALSDITANQAGTEIAFSEFSRGGGCGGVDAAEIIDTATGTLTTPKTPAGGGPEGWWAVGMWFDNTGTAYASLVPNQSTCTTSGTMPATYQPVGYLPIVCKLVNGTWVKTGSSGVFQASYGPGSWVAELTGSTNQANTMPPTVTVSSGKGHFTISGVTAFTGWAPSLSTTPTPDPSLRGTRRRLVSSPERVLLDVPGFWSVPSARPTVGGMLVACHVGSSGAGVLSASAFSASRVLRMLASRSALRSLTPMAHR